MPRSPHIADPKFNAAAAMCKIVNAAPATDLGAVEGMALAAIAAEYEVRAEHAGDGLHVRS